MRIPESQIDEITNTCDDLIAKLMELGCDSVQVVTTANLEGSRWFRGARGMGNLYARYGAVADWLNNQKDIELAYQLSEVLGGGE